MKFKYMIRGLGIGVIITAVVMGAYSRQAVADARVAVLREYGFGEESRLVGETEASSEVLSEEATDAGMTEQTAVRDEEKESEINSVLDAAKESEQAARTEAMGAEEPLAAVPSDAEASGVNISEPSSAIIVTPSDEGEAVETIEIVIASGDDSGTVARKLYNAGLIANASEYDAFLMQHGYDKRLSTGSKTIRITDSWQEIAVKITSK